ncbi:MAG: hypothetical protein E7264_06825 [Lachnospiraceae bacterium]|nr:hypothetical protein [Lachnospiraceae bacterium]
MSKKSSFGKFLAFTTTVAAIGGVCYVFRDQIKESSVYKKATDKFSDLKNRVQDKFASDDDDFFFDEDFEDNFEEDVFDEEAKKNREYTSITINPKEDAEHETDSANDASVTEDDIQEETTTDMNEDDTETESQSEEKTAVDSNEDLKEIFSDVSIPTISFTSGEPAKVVNESKEEEVLGYENEGLSDVSEDPDVLSDMDRLEF